MAEELTPLHPPLSVGRNSPPLIRGDREGLRVGIIGAGYAGMAAAVELTARSIPVVVFESAQQLGGRARGVSYNDTQLDNGQHLLLGCYRETLRLIELTGGNIEQDFLRLPLQLDLHGQFSLKAPRLPAPLHLLVALLTAQGLTLNERMKAARFMLALRRTSFKLPSHASGITSDLAGVVGQPSRMASSPIRGAGGECNDISVTELLAKHGQDADLTLKLWEPLCIASLNTPIHKASAQVLLNVLRDALNQSRADSDMLLPRIDFTALFPQRAAHYVEQHGGKVFTSCGVETVNPVEDGFEITTSAIRPEPSNPIRPEPSTPVRPEPVEGTNGASIHVSTSSTRTEDESHPRNSYRFTHVICAAPPTVAARLLRPIAALGETVAQIDALEHQPIYTLYLQYPPTVRLPHPMIGLHQRYSQWLFDKGQIAGQHGLLAAVISAEGIHQELSQEELAKKVIAELHEELAIAEQPEWFKVIAEKRATFCCSPNLHRPSRQTPLPRLLLAGDYTAGDYPATLEGAVMSGVKCAAMIGP